MLSYYAISAVVNCVSSLLACIFVVAKNPRSALNRSFGYFSFPVAVWAFFYFFWQANQMDHGFALYYNRMMMFPAIFIPIGFFHFLVNLSNEFKKYFKVLLIGYLIALCQVGLNFTPLFVADAKTNIFAHNWSVAGPLFFTHIIMFFAFPFYGSLIVYRKYKNLTGNQREQARYVLLGSAIGFAGGSLNYPLWYDIPIPPVTNILVFVYVLLFGYAVVKHQLMDIRIAITRAGIFLAVYSLALVVPFWLGYATKSWMLSAVSAMVLTIIGSYVYTYLRLAVEKKFFHEQKLILAQHEQLRRQKTMDVFSSSMAHEIINPVYAIMGISGVLKEKVQYDLKDTLSEKDKNYFNERLGQLVELSKRMDKMIKAIREFSSHTTGEFTSIDFNDVVTSCKLIVEPQFKVEGINCLDVIEPNLVFKGNKVLIEEVMINLAVNSIYAIKQADPQDKLIVLKAYRDNAIIRIEMKDNGIGIKPSMLEDIFLDFVTTKPTTDGLGMGLSRARKIIAMHHGKIWAESEGEGKGASLFIELPLFFVGLMV